MQPFLDLDAGSATPLREEAREAMEPYFAGVYGNPSSLHAAGRNARDALDRLADRLAAVLGRGARELTFTGSATEAVNLGVLGSVDHGAHIVCSTIEHHAVLASCAAHERRGGRVGYAAADASAQVLPEAVEAAMEEGTALVILMAANNEVGTTQPLGEVGALARSRYARLLTDASAAVGALPLAELCRDADIVALSAAKVGGPKGVGVLVAAEEPALRPVIHGGGQQYRRRSGTENLAGIAGMVTALELAEAERDATCVRLAALRDRLFVRIRGDVPELVLHGHPTHRLPGNLHVGVPGIDAEALVLGMDQEGVGVGSGAACTAPMVEPSHVLAAMGVPPELTSSGVRFSLGRTTTEDDIDRAAAAFARVVRRIRGSD